MLKHLNLRKKKQLSESIQVQYDSAGFEFIIIEHANFSAAFTLHGAQLLHFQLQDQQPIIWLSEAAIFNDQKAIRGGVPVCWPCFGKANNLPNHGFARTSEWSVESFNENTQGVEIEFLLRDSKETYKIWPYHFELTLKASLTDKIKLELISRNCDSKPFIYNAALHTYFNLSNISSCSITGLHKNYSDKLDASKLKTSSKSIVIDKPIDAIFQKSSTVIKLTDELFARNISIKNTGNDSEVVWNPWQNGAQMLTDMPDSSYNNMLCIESAITNPMGNVIESQQSRVLSTEISIESK